MPENQSCQTPSTRQLTVQQKLFSAMLSSEADLFFTHPLDTLAKQKQNTPVSVGASSTTSTLNRLKNIPYDLSKFSELYKGVSFSALNKLSSRTLRYLTQDKLQETIQINFSPYLDKFLREKQKSTLFGITSGAISSLFETTLLYPIDLWKTRSQLGTPNIYKDFYKGLPTGVIRASLSGGIFFGAYHYFSHSNNNKKKIDYKNNFLSTTKASLITTIATNPVEVIKTKLQAAPRSIGLFQMGAKIVKEEGVRAFSKGILARTLQAPIKVALPFFVFNNLKQFFEIKNQNCSEKNVPAIIKP